MDNNSSGNAEGIILLLIACVIFPPLIVILAGAAVIYGVVLVLGYVLMGIGRLFDLIDPRPLVPDTFPKEWDAQRRQSWRRYLGFD